MKAYLALLLWQIGAFNWSVKLVPLGDNPEHLFRK